MRTTKLTELTKLPTIKNTETIRSKDVLRAIKGFNHRLTKLPENPFGEFGSKALNVLDMKNTTKEEEESMQLGQMFGHSLNKMWEMVQKDRENNQIQNMLAPFGLAINGTADDYRLSKAA